MSYKDAPQSRELGDSYCFECCYSNNKVQEETSGKHLRNYFFNHPTNLVDCLCSSSLPSPSCSFLMESRWLTPTDQCNPWMDGRCITREAMLLWLTLWFSSCQCWCPVHCHCNVSDKITNSASFWWLGKTWRTLHLKKKYLWLYYSTTNLN